MNITATQINYYHLCKRKVWLFSNGITMEHNSDNVLEGNLIHEESYPQRAERYTELSIDGIKIDYYDAKNKIVHEIKKSNKMEQAHIAQLKYYLFVLERNGISGAVGVLEYPKLRLKEDVILTDEDRISFPNIEKAIIELIEKEDCPPTIKSKICKSCSYYDFCFVDE